MLPIVTLAAALVFSSALLLAPQHANADITSNLIAHWTFDEGSGTVVGDSTVNGFDGELFDSNGWAAGHIGGAIDFTDSDARVIVPNMLGEPDVPLTISAWLNVTDRPGKGTYFALGGHQIVLHLSGATDGISIEYEGSGCDNFGFCQTNTTTDLESAGWKHVVAVIDPESSLQEIYIDGVLATTSTHSNTFGGYDFAPYEHVCIGSSYACGTGEGWQMDGLMDDLRVYDRALTQSDVEELYAYDGGPAAAVALSRPPNNLGLVGYWSFDDGAGTVATDFSGNGRHATLGETYTWISGKRGKALQLNEPNQSVIGTVADHASLRPTAAITLHAWIRPAASTNFYDPLIGKPWDDFTGFGFVGYSSNFELRSRVVIDGVQSALAYTLPQDTWSALTMTYDGSVHRFYINGVLHNSENIAGSISQNTDPFVFRLASADDVDIDDVRLYNRALGPTEVAALARGGAARIGASSADLDSGSSLEDGLVGHWTFDGTDTLSTITDRSGQGNHGYFNGGATSSAKGIGVLGQALRFDGDNDYVQTSFNETLLPATITAWARVDSASDLDNCNGLVYARGTDVSGLDLGSCNDATRMGYTWNNDGSTWGWTGGPVIPIDKWFLAAVVVEASQATVYAYSADGLNSAVNTLSHTASDINDLEIGRNNYFDQGDVRARVDDVRIYDRALTAAEVKQLYNLGQVKITQ